MLRSGFTGGYSLYLRLVHCWVGVTFALATLSFARRFWRSRRREMPAVQRWRRAHVFWTVGAATAFTVSGALLWRQDLFSLAVGDRSAQIHLWLTYAASLTLVVHLGVMAIVPRVRTALQQAPSPPYVLGPEQQPQ